MEQWKPLKENPMYEVSDMGRVRSWYLWGSKRRTRAAEPRLLKPYKRQRWGHIQVTIPGIGKRSIHRLVLETFNRPRRAGEECRHLNGDPRDNRLVNLCWGTSLENSADQRQHETGNVGERNPMAKFTQAQVDAIQKEARYRRHGWVSATARKYGVHYNTISEMVNGKTWSCEKRRK